jgi:carboxylesterase
MASQHAVGFLLLHGLGAHNSTMKLIEKMLSNKGFKVDNVILPSHKTSSDDLQKINWEDWVNFAQERLDILKLTSNKIFIIGTSLGGIITLFLGAKNPDIDGLVTCFTAVKPYNLLSWIVYRFYFIQYIIKWIKIEKIASRYVGKVKDWESYEKIPTRSLVEIAKMLKNLRPHLKTIKQPLLIIHCINDKIVSIKGLHQII